MARAEFSGRPAAPGTAIGRLVRLGASAVQPRRAGTPEQEAAALAAAIAAAAADLAALAAQAGSDAAGIIEFQVAMLQDEALRAPALGRHRLRRGGGCGVGGGARRAGGRV